MESMMQYAGAARDRLNSLYLSAKIRLQAAKDRFMEETAGFEIVQVVIIIAIALVVAIAVRGMATHLIDTANTEITKFEQTLGS